MFRKKLTLDEAIEQAMPLRVDLLSASDTSAAVVVLDQWNGIYRQLRPPSTQQFMLWCSSLILDNQTRRYSAATGEEEELTRLKLLAAISQFPLNRQGDPNTYLSQLPPRAAWETVRAAADALIAATHRSQQN